MRNLWIDAARILIPIEGILEIIEIIKYKFLNRVSRNGAQPCADLQSRSHLHR